MKIHCTYPLMYRNDRQLRKSFQNAARNSLRETNLITKSLGKAGTLFLEPVGE